MIYLDSSALVKLAVVERETDALRTWLAGQRRVPWLTCDLARLEVTRAVMRSEPAALLQAYQVVARLKRIALTPLLLSTAASLSPPSLRTLHSIHLAAALMVRTQLTAVVVYDDRLADAASNAGLPVVRPA